MARERVDSRALRLPIGVGVAALALGLGACSEPTQHLSRDGMSFDAPADWEVEQAFDQEDCGDRAWIVTFHPPQGGGEAQFTFCPDSAGGVGEPSATYEAQTQQIRVDMASSLPAAAAVTDLVPSQLDGIPGIVVEYSTTEEDASATGFSGEGVSRLYFGVSNGVDRIWLNCGGPGDAADAFAVCEQIAESFTRQA